MTADEIRKQVTSVMENLLTPKAKEVKAVA
jgi:hypothetical protein